MSRQGRVCLVALVAAATAGFGCGSDNHTGSHDITFMGAVIDGATSTPLTAYTITLVYGSHTVKGKVDATTGRYTLGPLPTWNDYGILIDAGSGYRAFSSYNQGLPPPAPPPNTAQSSDIFTADTSQTFDFDAVLFPTSIMAPQINVSVAQNVPAAATPPPAAAGNFRLVPTSTQPSLQVQPVEVGGQLWTNDNDLFAAVVSGPFTGGSFSVTGDKLVYGVSYNVAVYGVDGFYQQTTPTVTAGVNLGAMVTLQPQLVLPLAMLPSTSLICTATKALTATSTGTVTFTFNQQIEDGSTAPGGGKELLDNGVNSYTTPSDALPPTGTGTPTVQERGTSFDISGTTLTISFNPSVAFALAPTTDSLAYLTYSFAPAAGTIYLQPVGHPEAKVPLYQLAGVSTINCAITN